MILSESFDDTMDFIPPHLGETNKEKMLHIPLDFPLFSCLFLILQIVYFFSQPIQSEKTQFDPSFGYWHGVIRSC